MTFKIVIPARYGSSRLPGKPLIPLGGKPMIRHVYERALKTEAEEIVIATDDERIRTCALEFGAQVVMTSSRHENGTERIAEVAMQLGWPEDTVIVNLQGDEPLIPEYLITQTANSLRNNPDAGMSSLCTPIADPKDAFNPNVVKVVMNKRNEALLFSRATIPWDRSSYGAANYNRATNEQSVDQEIVPALSHQMTTYRHIGMYGYRVSFLKEYVEMPACDLENTESLEQLRALWYGTKIQMNIIDQAPAHGIDTPEDVDRVERLLSGS